MSIRMIITAAGLMGLGLVGRAWGAEREVPPPPRDQVFERLDQNHDGVIQRGEFEQARERRAGARRFERGDRGPRGDRGQRGPRGIFRDGESCERRIDDAIDRAMKRAAGDPEELRRALRDELSQAKRRVRGTQRPAEGPLTAPDTKRWGRRRGAPPHDAQPGERARGFGERRRFPGGPQHRDPEEWAERIMERFDENDDGVLSMDEMEGERTERLLRADKDGNGRVDREELLGRLRKIKDDGRRGGRRDRGEPGNPPPPPPGE